MEQPERQKKIGFNKSYQFRLLVLSAIVTFLYWRDVPMFPTASLSDAQYQWLE